MLREVIQGGAAGLIATAPMTAIMRAGEHLVPRPWGGRLPPRQITERLLHEVGAKSQMDEDERAAAATVAHYGFGASAGCLLGAVAAQAPGASRPGLGVTVGLAVWAGSYLGWLPLAGIRRSATDEPAERNAQMIAAHVVWGCVAGALFSIVDRASKRGR